MLINRKFTDTTINISFADGSCRQLRSKLTTLNTEIRGRKLKLKFIPLPEADETVKCT